MIRIIYEDDGVVEKWGYSGSMARYSVEMTLRFVIFVKTLRKFKSYKAGHVDLTLKWIIEHENWNNFWNIWERLNFMKK